MTAEVEQPIVEQLPSAEESKPEESAQVTVTSETDSDSDDDVPDLEDAEDVPANASDAFAAAGIQEEPVSKSKQSRSEKKSQETDC